MHPTLGESSGEGLFNVDPRVPGRQIFFLIQVSHGHDYEFMTLGNDHISHVYGKLGTSSTQKYVWEGIG